MRTEKDSIGTIEIEDDALFGIHSLRAKNNFPLSGELINPNLIKYYLFIKQACLIANYKINQIDKVIYDSALLAISELVKLTDNMIKDHNPEIYSHIIVDPYQGGAGTSLNMNINEVITNLALAHSGHKPGNYEIIHPIDDVNKNQSTNDTYPTAFKAAALVLLSQLEKSFSALQNTLQKKETEFRSVLKLGRTQLQDAVPMTLGQEFGAYAQAISRDRWRFYNSQERLRTVNLGGTAIGNSASANNAFLNAVYPELRAVTNLPLAKAEDLIDGTQNLDVVVEVHAVIKAGAITVQKICNDLRLLSSGPYGGLAEINLPTMQAGSSIMPGKVNPVILENTIQICEMVKGHDVMISNLISQGNLELQQYMPMIAHLFLKTETLLNECVINLSTKCIEDITANETNCMMHLNKSTAISALLIPQFGYDKISSIVKDYDSSKSDFVSHAAKCLDISKDEILIIVKSEFGIDSE